MAFVVDNSVVCGGLSAIRVRTTRRRSSRVLDEQAHAPALWEREFANVLRSA